MNQLHKRHVHSMIVVKSWYGQSNVQSRLEKIGKQKETEQTWKFENNYEKNMERNPAPNSRATPIAKRHHVDNCAQFEKSLNDWNLPRLLARGYKIFWLYFFLERNVWTNQLRLQRVKAGDRQRTHQRDYVHTEKWLTQVNQVMVYKPWLSLVGVDHGGWALQRTYHIKAVPCQLIYTNTAKSAMLHRPV